MSKLSLKSIVVLTAGFFITGAVFCGCSKDKSPTENEETYYFMIMYGSSSSRVNLADFSVYTIEGKEAVKLSELIDTTVVTDPYNYAYRLIGTDGFYAHLKGSPDNTWDHMQSGYIVLSTMTVSFDTSLGLIKRYEIKDVTELKILRKIDFVTPADSLIQYIVDEMLHTSFEDSLNGIALTEFIPSEVVDSPSLFVYSLFAADGYSNTLTYEQLQQGFYVIEYDRVLYTNPEISGSLKIKMLNRLVAQYPSD